MKVRAKIFDQEIEVEGSVEFVQEQFGAWCHKLFKVSEARLRAEGVRQLRSAELLPVRRKLERTIESAQSQIAQIDRELQR